MAFIRYKTYGASGQRHYMVVENKRGKDKKVRQKVLIYLGKFPTVRAKIEQLQTEVNEARDEAHHDRMEAERVRSEAMRLQDKARNLREEGVYTLPRSDPRDPLLVVLEPVTVEQYRAHLLEQANR